MCRSTRVRSRLSEPGNGVHRDRQRLARGRLAFLRFCLAQSRPPVRVQIPSGTLYSTGVFRPETATSTGKHPVGDALFHEGWAPKNCNPRPKVAVRLQ
jgi:hypothetical protein